MKPEHKTWLTRGALAVALLAVLALAWKFARPPADDGAAILHALHMPQIHQITAVAAEKSVFSKQFLHPAHTLPQAICPLFRVDAHGVAVRLAIGAGGIAAIDVALTGTNSRPFQLAS